MTSVNNINFNSAYAEDNTLLLWKNQGFNIIGVGFKETGISFEVQQAKQEKEVKANLTLQKSDIKSFKKAIRHYTKGYKKENVDIIKANGEKVKAFTYLATRIDESLLPFRWYKYHVLHGAVENDLPPDYISFIDSFNSVADPDKENAADELSIYLKKTLTIKHQAHPLGNN